MSWLFFVIVAVAIVIFVVLRRRSRHDEPGMHSFRRHIDALSPEARREVIDRVRPQMNDDPDQREPTDPER